MENVGHQSLPYYTEFDEEITGGIIQREQESDSDISWRNDARAPKRSWRGSRKFQGGKSHNLLIRSPQPGEAGEYKSKKKKIKLVKCQAKGRFHLENIPS